MATSKRNWTDGYQAAFFWTGIVMTVACFALVLAGNTDLVHPLESASLPLSWAFAAGAIFQFVAAELCHQTDSRRKSDGVGQNVNEPQVVDFWR